MKNILAALTIVSILALLRQPVYAIELSMSDPSAKANGTVVETDPRPMRLKAYLTAKGSPMAQDADFFVNEADRLNVDWKLVAAIAGVESGFGQHIPTGSFNAWGWGVFTGTNDGVHFASWKDGITQVSEGLRTKYLDKGAHTVDEIGSIYAASPVWSYKVKWMISDIDGYHPHSSDLLAVTI